MIVYLNGRFVSEEQALVSVFDRSFLYGDGLFETIRIYRGEPFRWTQHFERLCRGAQFLKLPVPLSAPEWEAAARELVQRNGLPESVLRLTLSRGVGQRGYSPRGADSPNVVMTLHPAPSLDPLQPSRWRLITSSLRVPANDPVASHKTCNKLYQVLARAEAEAQGADEALLLNTDGEVVEAASSNVFWLEGSVICTTPLASGALAGVTRSVVLELCPTLNLRSAEKPLKSAALRNMDAIFLTVTSLEIVEVVSLDGCAVRCSPVVSEIRKTYRQIVERETVSEKA